LFHRIVTSGNTSPKPVTESLMLSKRENGNVPSGVASAAETVPAKEVLSRPYSPTAPTVSCPPKTGVAKV
jgi:hypothetical protein